MRPSRKFTGRLSCTQCGKNGSCRPPFDWCLCGSELRWEMLDRGCPDNPRPEQHGYVRVALGRYEPIYEQDAPKRDATPQGSPGEVARIQSPSERHRHANAFRSELDGD